MRKLEIPTEQQNLIISLHLEKGFMPYQISNELKSLGISISTSSVYRFLKSTNRYNKSIGEEIRTKSAGISKRGTRRSEDQKLRISEGCKRAWKSEELKTRFSKLQSRRWNSMSEPQWELYMEKHNGFKSKSEEILAKILSPIGFRWQYQYHGHIRLQMDFFHPELKVNIEVDGKSHSSESSRLHDCLRDMELRDKEIKVIRIKEL